MSNLEERHKSLSFGSMHTASSDGSVTDSCLQLFAEVEEVFPNPMVSKKGYLNVFDLPPYRNQWIKCYVVRLSDIAVRHCYITGPPAALLSYMAYQLQVIRRPYLFMFSNAKDPVDQAVVNLSTARIECSDDQQQLLGQ